jgi:hypothetical protein
MFPANRPSEAAIQRRSGRFADFVCLEKLGGKEAMRKFAVRPSLVDGVTDLLLRTIGGSRNAMGFPGVGGRNSLGLRIKFLAVCVYYFSSDKKTDARGALR